MKLGENVRVVLEGRIVQTHSGPYGMINIGVVTTDGMRVSGIPVSAVLSEASPPAPSEWGAPIATDGKRPAWLGDVPFELQGQSGKWYPHPVRIDMDIHFSQSTHIRLRSDHSAYTAIKLGFEPWGGGGTAPDDWDGGDVLRRGGSVSRPGPYIASYDRNKRWSYYSSGGYPAHDIIGYRKRPVIDMNYPRVCYSCGIGVDLHDRMLQLVREIAASAPPTLDKTAAIWWAHATAIAALLPPEPVDPLLVRARGIVEAEGGWGADDGSLAVRAVHRALREAARD